MKVTENFKLIYPNFEMEKYEDFMSTAKLVWEEFTGSNNHPDKKEKKEKPLSSVVQPIKVTKSKLRKLNYHSSG